MALWQAHYLQDQLHALGAQTELIIIKTKGDQIQHLGFDKIEGKGFFTKEIEDALLQGEIDMAVHSMKDMPTSQPDGLALTAVSYRENPADWLIIRSDAVDRTLDLRLKAQAVVGTSSARRKAQMLAFRQDIQLTDIRGNVGTRLDKVRQGQVDATLLAAAGLSRLELDLSGLEVVKFNPREFVPAPAQGVLAFQTLEADTELRQFLKQIHQSAVSNLTNIERSVLKGMGGGCHMPLGVYAERDANHNYHVWAAFAEIWDAPLKRVQHSSSTHFGLADEVIKALKNA